MDGRFLIPANTKKGLLKLQEKTLSSDNCNLDMPLYLNSFGTLSFVGRVYSMAGAEYYDHTFVLAPKRGFDEEEIALLSLDYYERMYNYRPGEAAALIDGEAATVQLYDNLDGHNFTSDWYELSTKNGKGKNISGDKIDVTFY